MAAVGQKRSRPADNESSDSDIDEDTLLAEDSDDGNLGNDDLGIDMNNLAILSDEEDDDDSTEGKGEERGLNLREYQKELAETAILGQNTIIHAATGAGKTRIAFYIVKKHLETHPNGRVAVMADKTFLVNQHFEALKKLMPEYKDKTLCMSGQKEKSGQLHLLIEGHSIIILTPALIENTIQRHDAKFMSKFSLLIFDECHHTQKKTNYNRLMTRYHVLKSQNETQLPQILGLTATLGTNKANSLEKAIEHALTVMANLDVSKVSTVVVNKEEYNRYRKDVTIDKIVLSDDIKQDGVHRCIEDCIRKTTDIICSHADKNSSRPDCDVDYENLVTVIRKRELVNPNDKQYLTWTAELSNAADRLMGRERDLAHGVRIGANYLKIYFEALSVNDELTGQYAVKSLDRKFKNEHLGQYSSSNSVSEIEYRNLVEDLMLDISNICKTDQSLEGKPVNILVKELDKYCKEKKEEARFIVYVSTRETSEMLTELLKTEGFKCACFTGSSAASEVGGTSRIEQAKIVSDFKEGNIHGIIATNILEEGFDIPDCDFILSYNYLGNEISMRQSAGRIRKMEGKHVLLSKQRDMVRESLNVQRGKLMDEALNSILYMSEDNIKGNIQKEQKRIVQNEINKKRNVAKVPKLDNKVYKLICRKCGKFEVDCNNLRSIQGQHHVVIQPDIWTKVRVRSFPKNPPRFAEEIICEGRLFGGGNDGCPHELGVVGTFRGARLPFLSYKFLLTKDETSFKTMPITKWADVPFTIQPINDPDDLTTMQMSQMDSMT